MLSNPISLIVSTLGVGTIISAIIVLILVLTFRPVVKVQFKNFSGPHGYGAPIWEAVIEVNGGRPAGISNLNVKFNFPSEISTIEPVSEGGFEGLNYHLDKLTKPKGFEYDRIFANTGRVIAKNCPSNSKAIFRFRLKASPCDEKPVPDEGSYEGKFDWTIPIINAEIPWSSFDFLSKLSGVIPASKQEQPFVNSTVIQKPPYYDLEKRKGDVHFYFEPDFFNKKLRTDTTIFSFCRPSTKFKLYFKKEGIIGAHIFWIYCKIPLKFETKVQPVNIEELKKDGLGVTVWVRWKEREANLQIRPTKKIKERDGSISLKFSPKILEQTSCSVSI